jgi:hypothetical protein
LIAGLLSLYPTAIGKFEPKYFSGNSRNEYAARRRIYTEQKFRVINLPLTKQWECKIAAASRRVIRHNMQFFDPDEPISNMSGTLPHWRQDGTIYFVTFRLADSLPQQKPDLWARERAEWDRTHPEPHNEQAIREYSRLFPERFHKWLDAGYGECMLANKEIKLLVENARSQVFPWSALRSR